MFYKIIGKINNCYHKIKNAYSNYTNKIQCICGKGTRFLRQGVIFNASNDANNIHLGKNNFIMGELTVFPHGGSIRTGDWVHIGDRTRIWSAASVSIGNRVQISYNVNIHDTNMHSLNAEERFVHMKNILLNGNPLELPNVISKPIVIEDDVWIGFNATILKGVRIGKGAIIGAGAVITQDVDEFTIVVGNPQRVVGKSS